MPCEFCKNEKSLLSDRKDIYATLQDGKMLINEDAKHESCAPGLRWVNIVAMFDFKFCPLCGNKVKE